MLTSFVVKKHFNKLTITFYVDCEKRDAVATLTYDRLLVEGDLKVHFSDVRTPEDAEAWLSATSSFAELGSRVEAIEHVMRTKQIGKKYAYGTPVELMRDDNDEQAS